MKGIIWVSWVFGEVLRTEGAAGLFSSRPEDGAVGLFLMGWVWNVCMCGL